MKSQPRRITSWFTSAAPADLVRQRLMPPAAALGLGLAAAGGLALVFPKHTLEEQLASPYASRFGGADALQIAYAQAWIKAQPHRFTLRERLAQQLIAAGDFAEAREQLAVLQSAPDAEFRERAVLLQLDLERAEIEALAQDDPQREPRLQAWRERLHVLAAATPLQSTPQHPLPLSIQIELAQRAASAGTFSAVDRSATLQRYEHMLAQEVKLTPALWQDTAQHALELGEPQLAARLYFAAYSAAQRPADQKRFFLLGLRTLQNAQQFTLALHYAEQGLERFSNDAEVLEFLVRLALAANRPDLAQRYVTRLLRISFEDSQEQMFFASVAFFPDPQGESPSPPGRGVGVRENNLPHIIRTQAQLTPDSPDTSAPDTNPSSRQPQLPFDERIYTLSYDVFLANSNHRDALLVAQSAVRHLPPNSPSSRVWRLRVAQVADWSNQPALALEQWHALARASGSAQDWAEVERRAPQVFDTARWIEALEFAQRREPHDLKRLRTLVDAYEQQGEPERAITLLQFDGGAATRQARLELLAQLAQRSGRLDLQRQTLRALISEFPTGVAQHTALAQLEFARGDSAAAFAVLKRRAGGNNVPAHTPEGYEFWHSYAQLARLLGHVSDARQAYARLSASPLAQRDDYTDYIAVLLSDPADPLQAAALSEEAYLRFNEPYFASQALYLSQRYGSTAQTRALLQRLAAHSPAFENDAAFLAQRASFELSSGNPRAAARDARRALALAPQNASARATLIWALIESQSSAGQSNATQDMAALRLALQQSSAAARQNPELRAALATGWLTLQEPDRALYWLRQRRDPNNPEWLLSLAEALYLRGQPESAWQLQRRAAILLLRTESESVATPSTATTREQTLVSIAPTFESGDAAQARMRRLLIAEAQTKETAQNSSQHHATLLAYWLAREHSEVARAWLTHWHMLNGHALNPSQPMSNSLASAELSVALAENDQVRITQLIEERAPETLPAADLVEGAMRVGRFADAQTFAFDAGERLPDNDVVHERVADRLLSGAPALGAVMQHFSQKPLRELTLGAEASARLTSRWHLGAQHQVSRRDSSDATQLAEDLPNDRLDLLRLSYAPEADSTWALSVQQRRSLASSSGVLFEAQRQITPRLRLAGALGWGQSTSDSVYMRIGAVRDLQQIEATMQLSQRESLHLDLSHSSFRAQAGGAGDDEFGSGSVARITLRHRLRRDYPDLSVRLGVADLRYQARPGLNAGLLPVLPVPLRAGASNATWLPESTQQVIAGIDCGENARFQAQRAWRGFCSFNLMNDSRNGTQFDGMLGARGRVFGGDNLELSISYGSAALVALAGSSGSAGAGSNPFTLWSIHYQWHY